jgi:putative nucleotidyltransferase with HDIG domain
MNENKRILIVDDNPSIHDDFDKILTHTITNGLNKEISELEQFLFGENAPQHAASKLAHESFQYQLEHAYSGEEAFRMVEAAIQNGNPYAMAFVDERMPPGWDGITAISNMWSIDPHLEIIICTAYSDYSWDEIVAKLGVTDHLLLLKKPFDSVEVKQMVLAITQKWNMTQKTRHYEDGLERTIEAQTSFISAMFEFANKLNSLNNLDDILDCITKTIQTFIRCERIVIMLVDERNEYLTIKKAVGLGEDVIRQTAIKTGEGIIGQVFNHSTTLVINDPEKGKFIKNNPEQDTFIGLPLLCCPLVGPKIKLGVIVIMNQDINQPFNDNDERIMSYIAYTASIAINNQLNELKLEDSFIGIINALTEIIDAKDHYTRGHSERVSELSVRICNQLNLSSDETRTLQVAAILHDIGKIGIPEAILCKADRLTEEEFSLIKEHPEIGDRILKDVKFLENARDIIRHHHERIDGSGYPDGLKGDEISIGAKIIGVADIFDSMNSNRPYRDKVSLELIKEELQLMSGTKIDADCVEALFRCLEQSHED